MSKRRRSPRKTPRAPRSEVALVALLHCKGGPMRDRRKRRPRDRRHDPLDETA
jgi:hypothetical protein